MNKRFAALFLVVLAGTCVNAQFDSANVLGTVRDGSGAVIVGANITITNLETGISAQTVTNETGDYWFASVRVGRYKLTAEKQGFAIAGANDVTVDVSTRRRVDFQLKPARMSESVEVTALPVVLETDSSQRAQVVSKARELMTPVIGASGSGKLIERILDVENMKNIRELRTLIQRS